MHPVFKINLYYLQRDFLAFGDGMFPSLMLSLSPVVDLSVWILKLTLSLRFRPPDALLQLLDRELILEEGERGDASLLAGVALRAD